MTQGLGDSGPPGAEVVTVVTDQGPARVHVSRARTGQPRARLVVGHGAGGGVDARDLRALARSLPAYGIEVVRVEQPWHVAGRRVAGPARRLDEAWLQVLAANPTPNGLPLVVGGRSAGARVAARTASALRARGALCLAFPAHPPGRPEVSRADEIVTSGVPVCVVQGERDPFGAAGGLAAELGLRPEPGGWGRWHAARPCASDVWLVGVAGADHQLRAGARGPLTQQEVDEVVVRATLGWLDDLLGRAAPPTGEVFPGGGCSSPRRRRGEFDARARTRQARRSPLLAGLVGGRGRGWTGRLAGDDPAS